MFAFFHIWNTQRDPTYTWPWYLSFNEHTEGYSISSKQDPLMLNCRIKNDQVTFNWFDVCQELRVLQLTGSTRAC